jgi:hypothetical protein
MGRHIFVRSGIVAFAKLTQFAESSLRKRGEVMRFHNALSSGIPVAQEFLLSQGLDKLQPLTGEDIEYFHHYGLTRPGWIMRREDTEGLESCLMA